MVFLQLIGEAFQHLLFPLAVALEDAPARRLELVVLEQLRDARGQEVNRPVHVLAEGDGQGARQGEQAGLVGAVEVVHVAAVGRRGALRTDALEQLLDGGGPPGAAQAADKDVVARPVELDAELQGFQGALLPDDALERLQVGRGLEVELRRVAAPAELVGENLAGLASGLGESGSRHGFPLTPRRRGRVRSCRLRPPHPPAPPGSAPAQSPAARRPPRPPGCR